MVTSRQYVTESLRLTVEERGLFFQVVGIFLEVGASDVSNDIRSCTH